MPAANNSTSQTIKIASENLIDNNQSHKDWVVVGSSVSI
jgi:hypothetical protein